MSSAVAKDIEYGQYIIHVYWEKHYGFSWYVYDSNSMVLSPYPRNKTYASAKSAEAAAKRAVRNYL